MLAILLAALLTSPEAQAAAVERWCASQPLQVAERKPECNPVLAERIRSVARFLDEVELDRINSLANPFKE